LTFVLWLLGPAVFNLKDPDAYAFWNADAVFHLAVLVTLLMFLLTSYDLRFPYDWCFRGYIVASAILLILVEKLLLLTAFTTTTRQLASATVTKIHKLASLMAAALTALDNARRDGPPHLTFEPLSHSVMMRFKWLSFRGVSRRSDTLISPPAGYARLMSTYELVPYPIAFFSAIFGPSIIALRLPALLFGTLTIGLRQRVLDGTILQRNRSNSRVYALFALAEWTGEGLSDS